MSTLPHWKEVLVDLVSGMAAGGMNVVVGLPMDTIKVKMQTFPAENPAVVRCFMDTVRNEGFFRGLYAGATPALVANVCENATLFVAYGRCQKLWARILGSPSAEEMPLVGNALSGSTAAAFSSLVLCPTEHVKCQLQVRRELSKIDPHMNQVGPWQLTREILSKEGLMGGLYKGIKPTWSRELPGYFFFFGGYETTKAVICSVTDTPKAEIGLGVQLLCGAMAGVTFWTGIFPLDVIKSRIQVLGVDGSMTQVATNIYSKFGIRGFYRGLAPCLLRAFPSTAALLATYEYASYYLTESLKETPPSPHEMRHLGDVFATR